MLMTLVGTPGRRRWLLLAALVAGIAMLLPIVDGDYFRIYASRPELLRAQKKQHFVLVGTFGRADWPAIVVARETGDGGVSFVTADSQPHEYQGFSGPMKALEFRAGLTGGKRFTLVFHQVASRPEDSSPFKGIR